MHASFEQSQAPFHFKSKDIGNPPNNQSLMVITVTDIQQIFAKYNELCFEGKLPMPRIRIGHAKGYLGQLRYTVKKEKNGEAVPCRQRGDKQTSRHGNRTGTGGPRHQTQEKSRGQTVTD